MLSNEGVNCFALLPKQSSLTVPLNEFFPIKICNNLTIFSSGEHNLRNHVFSTIFWFLEMLQKTFRMENPKAFWLVFKLTLSKELLTTQKYLKKEEFIIWFSRFHYKQNLHQTKSNYVYGNQLFRNELLRNVTLSYFIIWRSSTTTYVDILFLIKLFGIAGDNPPCMNCDKF